MKERGFFNQRKIFCISCFFGAGVFAGFVWKDPAFYLIIAGAALSFLAAVFYIKQRQSAIKALCLLSFFLGLLRCAYANNPVLPPEGKVKVSAEACGESSLSRDGKRARITLKNALLEYDSGEQYSLPKAYLTYYANKEALPFDGQKMEFSSRLYHPSPAQNPYGFDLRLYLLQKGIPAALSGARDMRFAQGKINAHANPFLRLKLLAEERLDAVFKDGSALPKALLTGSRDGISEETKESFRLAGIAHLLAISGLHISLLVYALSWTFTKLKMPRGVINFIILLFLAFYCVFLNFSSSVVRASIMAAALILGKTARRRRDTLTSLSLAFLIILVFKPLELFNAGFQLSFLAVSGIALSVNSVRYFLRHRPYRKIHNVCFAYGVSLGAALFTLPVTANAFHFAPFVSLLLSPAAALALGVLMPAYLFVFILSFVFMPLANILAVPVNLAASVFEYTAKLIARVPFSAVQLPAFPWHFTFFYYCFLVLLSRYTTFRFKTRAAVIVFLALFSIGAGALKYESAVTYTMLSVGKGDSACIEDRANCYIIDTGSNGYDLAEYVLSRGKRVNAVFISHLHDDHAGGLEQLIEKGVKIDKIYLSCNAEDAPDLKQMPRALKLAEESGIPVCRLSANDSLDLGRVKISVLWPYENRMHNLLPLNERSLALKISLDGVDFLSCGDLGTRYEKYAAVPADILKASHHGSKNALSEEFLHIAQPDYVLVSSGKEGVETAARLREKLKNAKIITSFSNGAIKITCEKGKAYIRRFN